MLTDGPLEFRLTETKPDDARMRFFVTFYDVFITGLRGEEQQVRANRATLQDG